MDVGVPSLPQFAESVGSSEESVMDTWMSEEGGASLPRLETVRASEDCVVDTQLCNNPAANLRHAVRVSL